MKFASSILLAAFVAVVSASDKYAPKCAVHSSADEVRGDHISDKQHPPVTHKLGGA